MEQIYGVNLADIIVILILIINGFGAYRRGFIITVFRLTSLILTILLTYKFYPAISTFIRNSTGLYETLKNNISNSINMDAITDQLLASQGTEHIKALQLPDFIKDSLVENNNYEIYNILQVDNLKEYISGYLANICINVISAIGVFLLIFIILKTVESILDVITRLPVLKSINRMFGLVLGLCIGCIMIWVLCTCITFFYANPQFENITQIIETSKIAKVFYYNNIILDTIVNLFV